MNRSLVIPAALFLACGLAGCRAQGESRELRNAVTKLEQQMKNVDRYLSELERDAGKQQKQRQDQLAEKALELAKLRAAFEEQQRAERAAPDRAARTAPAPAGPPARDDGSDRVGE